MLGYSFSLKPQLPDYVFRLVIECNTKENYQNKVEVYYSTVSHFETRIFETSLILMILRTEIFTKVNV